MKDKRKISQIKKLKMCKPNISSDYKFIIEWWEELNETAIQRCITFDSESIYTELTTDGHDVAGQVMLYILLDSLENSDRFRKKFKDSVLNKLNSLDLSL